MRSRAPLRRAAAGALLLAAALSLEAAALAQLPPVSAAPPPPVAPPPPAPDVAGSTEIDLPLLLDLPGDLVFVRYTPGTLDRAAAVQKRFEIVAKEFSRTGFLANSLVIYVLSRDDWQEAGLRETYGLPLPLGLEAIVVAGTADEAMVESLRARMGGGELPPTLGKPILMSADEASALAVSDLLTQLEVVRMLVKRAHLGGDVPWIEPLAVHLVTRLTWDRYEPGRIATIAPIFDRIAAGAKGGYRLADWRDDLPFPERTWFDARFLRAADVMAIESRAGKIWKLLYDGTMRTKPITEAGLIERYKGLAAWKAANFAP